MPTPVTSQAGRVCTDPVFLCWLEERPGLASWMQFVGAMAAIVATVAPFIVQMVREGRAQKALKANALVAATNAVQAMSGTTQYLLSPDGVSEVRNSSPQVYLVENGLAELDKAPIYSVHDPDFIAQYQLIRMAAVAMLAGIPDLVAVLKIAEPDDRLVSAMQWRVEAAENALQAMAKRAKLPMPTPAQVAEYTGGGQARASA